MNEDGITITVDPDKVKSVLKMATGFAIFAGIGVLYKQDIKHLGYNLKCSKVDMQLAKFASLGIYCALGTLASSYFDDVIDESVDLTTAFASIFED